MDLTIGLRPRLGLPQNFLGSPIFLLAIPSLPSDHEDDKQTPTLSATATHIRTHLNMFSRPAIAALLHDAAFEVSPQRLWRACLGREHVLQTSWVNSGFQEVDFVGEGGVKLRFVMPEMGGDGLLLLMEGLGDEKGERWTRNGVDALVFFEEGCMERLVEDRKLWGKGVI